MLFHALQQPLQHVGAHEFGLVVNRRVTEPITISAVDVASRCNLDQHLRDWLIPKAGRIWIVSRHAGTGWVRGNYRLNLVPDKPAAPESAAAAITRPAKTAGPAASYEAAAPEIDLSCFRVWFTQIAQQCVDALMVALERCARPMQLQDTRKDLQCGNRHVVLRFLATQ